MITGLLVLGLLVTREVVRPDRTGVVVTGRLLVPAAAALAVVAVVRLLDLVVGGA